MSIQELLILGLVTIVVALTFGWWWSAGLAGRRSRARVHRAQVGESDAERLLESMGYRVVDRQVPGETWMTIDGDDVAVQVRADLIVERDREPFVAEVKTGRLAPDPTYPPTRRQLLEYGRAFPDHGLLLVDVELGVVSVIGFP